MGPDDRQPASPEQRWAARAFALLLVAAALAGATPRYIPTHDGPQHVYAVHVSNHLGDTERGWSDWLETASPVTSLGFAALFAPLDLALPWPLALRIALTALALAWVWAAYAFARALAPERAWLGVALGGAAYSWTFYMGLFSFHLASAVGLGLLAWAFGAPRPTRREIAFLSLGLFVVALMHVVAAFLTGVVLAALLAFRAAPGARGAAAARIAAVALPSAGVALALLSPGFEQLSRWNGFDASGVVYESAPWWTLGKCFTGGPAWRAWPLTALAVAAIAIAVARRSLGTRPEDRALLVCGSAGLAAGALLPLDIPMWDFFSPRFLPLATSALVLTLPLERLAAPRRALVAAGLCGFAFAATAWAGAYHHHLAAASADALSGLDAPIVRRGVRLPIVFEPYAETPGEISSAPMPYALPLVNIGQLYAASQGGVTPYGFVLNPRMHHLVVRDDAGARAPAMVERSYVTDLTKPARRADRAFRTALLTHLASEAGAYEDVIFYGRPEEADRLRELGFVEDWRRGGLSIARFRGCPLRAHFSPAAVRASGGRFELGWYPSWHASATYDLARGASGADGSRTLELRESCGALWLRFPDAEAACEGADAEGRLRLMSARSTPELVCRMPGERWAGPEADHSA